MSYWDDTWSKADEENFYREEESWEHQEREAAYYAWLEGEHGWTQTTISDS